MENENGKYAEKGFESLEMASKKILSKGELDKVNVRFIEIPQNEPLPGEKYPITNAYLIAMYDVLPKERFNAVQKEWVNEFVEGHDEIFVPSLLETLVNYNRLVNGSDIKVEPDGKGAKITMNAGCMYSPFCNRTGNRTCLRGKATKRVVTYKNPEAYVCLLERPEKSYACVIRLKPSIEASDVIEEYRRKNQQVVVL